MGKAKKGSGQYIYSVRWSNPYNKPPDGQPEVLGQMTVNSETSGAPGCPEELRRLHVLGSGYALYCDSVPVPIQHWSPERLFAYRRKRLERRIRKKYPLFAEQMIEEAMRAKPDYYGVAS